MIYNSCYIHVQQDSVLRANVTHCTVLSASVTHQSAPVAAVAVLRRVARVEALLAGGTVVTRRRQRAAVLAHGARHWRQLGVRARVTGRTRAARNHL